MKRFSPEQRQRLLFALRLIAIPAAWLSFVGFCVLIGLPMPCLIYQITGLQCPSCGLTRAVVSLLHGEYFLAIQYNLLIIPLTFAAILVIVDTCRFVWTGKTIWNSLPQQWPIGLVVLLLAYAAVRNIISI